MEGRSLLLGNGSRLLANCRWTHFVCHEISYEGSYAGIITICHKGSTTVFLLEEHPGCDVPMVRG
jgi:hypothetical protein